MLVVGLGATFGLAALAYLALTAYLGMLVCWRITSNPAARAALPEGDRR